jgi:Flp pilus assembly protein TadB
LFTGLRTARRALKLAFECQERLDQLERALKAGLEHLDLLETHHKQLRGRFYATRFPAEAGAESPPATSREARRAEAFKQRGIIPGKPVNLDSKGH